ncbi:hypothetical protein AMAG_12833 [Allomyces macrogynus ATCC 38327]|uniref:Uncharacterized protein n=1 Tax=Allomyces macrogynus (strain ATCC 38327) TaxID=578462 RepID=A0A0L0T214_ALLM3|nr:hypothetical protein AMAG_12833 [Allomyces macrogynus ATCC 38327]|eukprot:KNE68665.1 hypothetical protein AMAG_12833 [Allomyces macrogynus ATCC 38327]
MAAAQVNNVVGAPHSIVTNEPTEILRVSKVDFLKLMTPRALACLEAQARKGVTACAEMVGGAKVAGEDPVLRAVQERYLVHRQWMHRKQVFVRRMQRTGKWAVKAVTSRAGVPSARGRRAFAF